ncbi:DUF2829 domain-containing protein [Lactobacillus sp. YT155]|uniref:DUF2829 domain-containing protein n=1 Tax=Lactobacillus sp. YT155 TaxID=3060955 RepID=UPI00265F650F|nr:DUF2829 domain-containing protein [Lactobacillus sp. YT155]MDO1605491.1 DUF2829 domain-containing protein [Lactobacillus sp. YT155]
MNFEEALKEMKNGKKITRDGWQSGEVGIFIVNNSQYQGDDIGEYILIETNEQPKYYMFQPTSCDVLADDWRIVK